MLRPFAATQGSGLPPQAAAVKITLLLTAKEFEAALRVRLRIGRP